MQSDKNRQLVALLQDAGVLAVYEVEKALAEQPHANGNLLQTLLASGALSFEALQEALLWYGQSAVAAPPTPEGFTASPTPASEEAEGAFAEQHIDEQQLQTFLLTRGRLTREQLDGALVEQQHTGHPLWRTLINLQLLTPQDMMEVLLALATESEGSTASPVSHLSRREREWHTLQVDATTTAVQLVNAILAGAVRARATDIHIEPQTPRMRVRYRIDGMLFDVMAVPSVLEMSVISRLKILADMDITERRLPQDGHITTEIAGQEYHMRVATIPTKHGEKLVLRLLSKSNVLTGLKQLGLEPEDERCLRRLIAKPQGMILVTGPIGSGKTTTLYAALNEVNILTSNIVTIEDPVEYQLAGINQVEVDTKAGLTFASGLRSILRQDANILMVGEIRDVETATVAVRAALTGQQLFSTLHTIDAPSAITTLEHFGIQPYLIASALSGVVAQRLVRRVCMACRRWYTPSPAVLKQLGLSPGQQEYRFAYGVGCEECYHTGYLGRTGLFEILLVSDTLRHLIVEQAGEQQLQVAARREGMSTLAQGGVKKILQGITTPQEVMREVFL
jgi:type II secretory ATPase GspE/PulE/Tfp pilus assembly ATPase PilB-like protein